MSTFLKGSLARRTEKAHKYLVCMCVLLRMQKKACTCVCPTDEQMRVTPSLSPAMKEKGNARDSKCVTCYLSSQVRPISMLLYMLYVWYYGCSSVVGINV